MSKFDKILRSSSEEELESLKVWLFRENIRIQSEKKEIDALYRKFESEKKQFQSEMKLLNRRIQTEKKRLSQDEEFFEKKRQLLESAFRQLDLDRKKLEQEKQILENNRRYMESNGYYSVSASGSAIPFFNGVSSSAALRKRYKDLMKIFHPDNAGGDKNTVQLISQEYSCLKQRFAGR